MSTKNIGSIIDELRKLAEREKDNKALGRYQGWALCSRSSGGAAYAWIKENYTLSKEELAKHDIHLLRWSDLSRDGDDFDDFALRLGIRSP